jgi:hypothetical protein
MADPIQVLRDYKKGVILVDFDPDMRKVSEDEWDTALAQVEALVETARAYAEWGSNGIYTTDCPCPSCRMAAALVPFVAVKENS